MSDKHLSINIVLDHKNRFDDNSASMLSGVVIIKSTKDITIDSILGEISIEIKGKMSAHESRIFPEKLLKHSKNISKDVKYEFPFSVSEMSSISTYKGRNASILFKYEVEVYVKPDDYKKVKPGIISSIKSMVTNKTVVKSSRYFDYQSESRKYKVRQDQFLLSRKNVRWLTILFAVVITLIFCFFLRDFEVNILIFAGLGSLATGFLLQMLYVRLTESKIGVYISSSDELIKVKVEYEGGFGANQPKLYYHVMEKVIDDRGTSTRTYKSKIFNSEVKNLASRISEGDIEFAFPTRTDLQSRNYSGLEIYWVICVETKDAFGIKAVYSENFEVYNIL